MTCFAIGNKEEGYCAYLIMLPSIREFEQLDIDLVTVGDEDMTPMDVTMIVKYKMSLFLYLHNDFWYNSLGSTCTCQSLIVGTNVKLKFWFVGRLIVNHCEHHNSVIRSAIEVHELLMESLFDKLI
jgi:hypothetical protein